MQGDRVITRWGNEVTVMREKDGLYEAITKEWVGTWYYEKDLRAKES